jgi:tRNA threonylcarbamoyl adenosine modification protein YeaZ
MARLGAMISLAIDTSAHLCAAALHDSAGDAILAEASEDIGRGHAERLMDIIAVVLSDAGLEYSAIARVIVTVGPGSFTGIRVGLATARGIALGLGIEACGVGVLEAAAEVARQNGSWDGSRPLMAVLDAKRGEAYGQAFGEAAGEPFVAPYHHFPPQLSGSQDWLLCGSGARHVNEAAGTGYPVLHQLAAMPISVIARLGASRKPSAARPEPLYLRAPDAKPQQAFVLNRA